MDYREFVVCMRILENFRDIPNKARTLLLRFYDLWSTPTGSIPRAHCLKLVAVAAESEQEVYATRGLFDQTITNLATHYGLKSSTTEVPRELFLEVLEMVPTMVKSFQVGEGGGHVGMCGHVWAVWACEHGLERLGVSAS